MRSTFAVSNDIQLHFGSFQITIAVCLCETLICCVSGFWIMLSRMFLTIRQLRPWWTLTVVAIPVTPKALGLLIAHGFRGIAVYWLRDLDWLNGQTSRNHLITLTLYSLHLTFDLWKCCQCCQIPTREAMYVYLNTETRSRNLCCRGKAIRTTYSVCARVCVAVVTQRAKTDVRTDMTMIIAFRNFANSPDN